MGHHLVLFLEVSLPKEMFHVMARIDSHQVWAEGENVYRIVKSNPKKISYILLNQHLYRMASETKQTSLYISMEWNSCQIQAIQTKPL